jgi:hypothetical protein
MALLRKKNPEWKPSEQRDLEVGELIEVSDYRRLVEGGDAELVDESGNVLPLPGTVFVCGICYEKVGSHGEYVEHIMKTHADQPTLDTSISTEEPAKDEEKPLSFGEKMAKARAAKKAEREAEKAKA